MLSTLLKQDSNYEEAQYRTGYFYYPGNHTAPPALCVNIRRSGKTGYRLLIRPGELPLDDTFGFVAEHLASLISYVLSTKSVAEHDTLYPLHRIFHNLLTNSKADYVEVSHQLTENGWLSSHSYQCILIKTGILDWKNSDPKIHLQLCGKFLIPAACAVEHRGNVVVYINLDLCDFTLDEISQKLAGFIRDSLLIAGYSRVMLGHFNFQRQYVQASISIQTGSRKNPTSWIHHFNDVALPYILEQITEASSYMICHEKLLHLKYQDESTGTQLYETLRVYLQNHQSATKTAAALYIHRSTLLYRIEKIEAALKSDLTDPDELLYLMLSFYLMDQEEKIKEIAGGIGDRFWTVIIFYLVSGTDITDQDSIGFHRGNPPFWLSAGLFGVGTFSTQGAGSSSQRKKSRTCPAKLFRCFKKSFFVALFCIFHAFPVHTVLYFSNSLHKNSGLIAEKLLPALIKSSAAGRAGPVPGIFSTVSIAAHIPYLIPEFYRIHTDFSCMGKTRLPL